jgi:hypothetical protein
MHHCGALDFLCIEVYMLDKAVCHDLVELSRRWRHLAFLYVIGEA